MARLTSRIRAALTLVMGLTAGACSEAGPEWVPMEGLKTRWAADVDPAAPLPEYPRPQMVRGEWINLNGIWEIAVDPGIGPGEAPSSDPQAHEEAESNIHRVLVPFPVESALSGLGLTVTPESRLEYRRTFSLPEPSTDEPTRWLLHFGAVDWEAEVMVNGTSLGIHRGGYDPFSFDISDVLVDGPEQELRVVVTDPTSEGTQPRGKQVLDPHGIWYTAVTGIWQTVWLEPVPEVHVAGLRITPNLEGGAVQLLVETAGATGPIPFQATVSAGGEEVASAEGLSTDTLAIPIQNPRLWSPDDPFLYDLEVRLGSGPSPATGSSADVVESYFGMRSIGLGPDENGHQRLLLNGEPLFQYGLLDQGWWPDGLYTAPTDEALLFDIRKSRELGFNLIRKHVKVEPARWYYHCDREGILVWQDMPSGDNEEAGARAQFARELEAVLESLWNHPSIVMWVPFNEGWGQHDTEAYVHWLQEADPSRLVNNASGWTDTGVGSVLDIHRYPGPGNPSPRDISPAHPRAAVLGEFGGLGLPIAGHTWVEEDNWGYRSYETLEELNRAYENLLLQLRPFIGEGLAAAVYTQTTDVEIEVNGIMTYDREVVKLDAAARELHAELFGPQPLLRAVLETSRDAPRTWRYTTSVPAEGWEEEGFDDSSWANGPGGFGTEGTPGAVVRTVWDTSDIWLRRSFSLSAEEAAGLSEARLFLRIHHDEDAEIFLNGQPIATLEGYTGGYGLTLLDPAAIALLRAGANTLAAHVRQTRGGQYIDLGIVEWVEGEG